MVNIFFVSYGFILLFMIASSKQATNRKMALGIKATNIPISFIRTTLKYIDKFILLIILIIGINPHRDIKLQVFSKHSGIICALILFIGFSMVCFYPKKANHL
jgi:hypothetical protein